MRDICIPLPGICEGQADVFIFINNNIMAYHYRVESFLFKINDIKNNRDEVTDGSEEQIKKLKKAISEYDKDWELVQIYEPAHNSKYIQLLYRKKL